MGRQEGEMKGKREEKWRRRQRGRWREERGEVAARRAAAADVGVRYQDHRFRWRRSQAPLESLQVTRSDLSPPDNK